MVHAKQLVIPMRLAAAAAVLGCLAAFTFIGALHSPKPHAIDLALVGEAQTTGPVAIELEEEARGAFDIHPFHDRDDALHAVRDRRVAAAYLPGTSQSELLLAGANGAMQATTLRAIFGRLAGQSGSELSVDDVLPTPSGDRAGLAPFLMVVSLTIPALALAVLTAVLGGRAGLTSRMRLAAALVGAVCVALVNTCIADFALDALSGHFWQVFAVAALAVFALSSATLALQRLCGPAGIGLAVVLFMVVGMPTTGAAIGPSFLPGVLRALTLALPAGEAVPAFRGVQYFDGADTATALWLLVAWGVTASVVMLARPSRRIARENGAVTAAAAPSGA
jgi:hypothetical protein